MTTTAPVTTPSTPVTASPDDRALKAKHAAMWASGSYATVADQVVGGLGAALVAAVDPRPGQRVLDVAAGTGSSAVPAALRGAGVVATDLTPALVDHGRAVTDGLGLAVDWRVADAEALPFADAGFDGVLSCIGVMFAPHHQQAADELVRVCRPGGTLGVLSWTPDGFIGRLFATMKPYAPPPPPGASPAPMWGDAGHVRGLLGDRVEDVLARQDELVVDRFPTGAEFRDFFKDHYGPTIAVYRHLGDDASRVSALDADLAALGEEFLHDGVMGWEYLLVTARRA